MSLPQSHAQVATGSCSCLLRPLRWIHLNSLDAPAVAVVWLLAFAHAAAIVLPHWIPLALGLACWSFYLLDRLLDARRSLNAANRSRLRARHLHHWRFRQILFPIALAAFVTAAVLALAQMSRPALLRNGALAAATLLYFSGVHGVRLSRPTAFHFKELFVALIFTSACMAPVLARMGNHLIFLPAFLAYSALAWFNCYAIEAWERTRLTALNSAARVTAAIAAALVLSRAVFLAPAHPQRALLLLCALASAALLFLLDRLRHRFSPLALRIAADLVLLTPALLLLPGFKR